MYMHVQCHYNHCNYLYVLVQVDNEVKATTEHSMSLQTHPEYYHNPITGSAALYMRQTEQNVIPGMVSVNLTGTITVLQDSE